MLESLSFSFVGLKGQFGSPLLFNRRDDESQCYQHTNNIDDDLLLSRLEHKSRLMQQVPTSQGQHIGKGQNHDCGLEWNVAVRYCDGGNDRDDDLLHQGESQTVMLVFKGMVPRRGRACARDSNGAGFVL